MTKIFTHVSFLIAFSLMFTACGKDESAGERPIDINRESHVYPADKSVIGSGPLPQFTIKNNHADDVPGLYTFYLVADDETATEQIATSAPIAEDPDGIARWTPGLSVKGNRPYSWRYTVTYDNGDSDESETFDFYMTIDKNITPRYPRAGGYHDKYQFDLPLAVNDAYTRPGAPAISYDFEFFAGANGEEYLNGAIGVDQGYGGEAGGTLWTHGYSGEGGQFSWRVRVWIGEAVSDWSPYYSFTSINPCEISGSIYAEYVSAWTRVRQCDDLINTDPNEALGPRDAGGFVTQDSPGTGFVSIDYGGYLDVEMGKTVLDGPGDDIRVYEYYAVEGLEVFAAPTAVGPWISLGATRCGHFCDFDLASGGLAYARFFRVLSLHDPADRCYQTAGPDIDAWEALNITTSVVQCL